jgi:hypothetical protein
MHLQFTADLSAVKTAMLLQVGEGTVQDTHTLFTPQSILVAVI